MSTRGPVRGWHVPGVRLRETCGARQRRGRERGYCAQGWACVGTRVPAWRPWGRVCWMVTQSDLGMNRLPPEPGAPVTFSVSATVTPPATWLCLFLTWLRVPSTGPCPAPSWTLTMLGLGDFGPASPCAGVARPIPSQPSCFGYPCVPTALHRPAVSILPCPPCRAHHTVPTLPCPPGSRRSRGTAGTNTITVTLPSPRLSDS